MNSESIYFYLNSSRQNEGPFTWQELELLKNKGTINNQTYIISTIDKQWSTLANISHQIQPSHNPVRAPGRQNATPTGNKVSLLSKMLKRNPILNYFFLPITKSYFDFSGRATRKEFWMFCLLCWVAEITYLIVAFACMFLFSILLGTTQGEQGDAEMRIMSGIFTVMPVVIVLNIIGFLFLIIPNLALAVRRLHDTGYSGVSLLLYFIPFIGPLVILILLAQPSKLGENEYGPQPKNR